MRIRIDPQNFDSKGRQRIKVDSFDLTVLKKDNDYFAFDSKCPHKGGPLFLGKPIGENGIMCPSHHIIFDIRSGEVIENPIPESMSDYRICGMLRTFNIETNDGKINVIVD